MSSYTPSNDDIISPDASKKDNKSPLWAVILVIMLVLCCLCLCLGVVATWFLRFGISFVSGLLGGFHP
jgi:hypothetical protein